MENLLFLGVPIFKHIRVDLFPFGRLVEKHETYRTNSMYWDR